MKKAFAIFLLFIIVLQSNIKVGIIAYFYINQQYIASALCENKDKPMTKCHGKCYLNKMLKEEKAKETILHSLKTEVEGIASQTFFVFEALTISSNTSFNTHYISEESTVWNSSIFHPPQFSL